jgi:hypothetical protein
MVNLAGVKACDYTIKDELERAEIEIVSCEPENTEVPYTIIGILKTIYGDFKFKRAWKYWIVFGKVPLDIAKKIFSHPEGKKYIRIFGDCGCIDPMKYQLRYFDRDGRELISQKTMMNIKKSKLASEYINSLIEKGIYKVVEDEKEGISYITSYHIDTQAGLLLFSQMITNKLK